MLIFLFVDRRSLKVLFIIVDYSIFLSIIENDYNHTRKKDHVYTCFSTLIDLTPISSTYSSISQGQTIPIILKWKCFYCHTCRLILSLYVDVRVYIILLIFPPYRHSHIQKSTRLTHFLTIRVCWDQISTIGIYIYIFIHRYTRMKLSNESWQVQ